MLGAPRLRDEIKKGNSGDQKFLSIIPAPEYQIIKGASIDLHLGRWFSLPYQSKATHHSFRNESAGKSRFAAKEHFVHFNKDFVLHPGRFVLAVTLEWIKLPDNRAAYVNGKSKIGRRGLVIETAPGVHPWFNGCLTLEMANLGEIPLEIYPGMEICQLFVHETDPCPEPDSEFLSQIKPTFGKNI